MCRLLLPCPFRLTEPKTRRRGAASRGLDSRLRASARLERRSSLTSPPSPHRFGPISGGVLTAQPQGGLRRKGWLRLKCLAARKRECASLSVLQLEALRSRTRAPPTLLTLLLPDRSQLSRHSRSSLMSSPPYSLTASSESDKRRQAGGLAGAQQLFSWLVGKGLSSTKEEGAMPGPLSLGLKLLPGNRRANPAFRLSDWPA